MNNEQFTITRDGKVPMRFHGAILAQANNRHHSGPRQNRWSELVLYRTASGRFVIYRANRTCWEGESDNISADHLDSAQDVIHWLRVDHDGLLTDVAQELLTEAAKVDASFRDAYVENVE